MAAKSRILIVEDDAGTINLLSHIVKRAGYEAILARNGTQALRHLQEMGADLILLDLMMKEMDGWTFLQTIRSGEQYNKPPVIIISARHPREDPLQIQLHAGKYDAYFLKPFEVEQLVAKIAELLSQGQGE